jgi:hypothetical protein
MEARIEADEARIHELEARIKAAEKRSAETKLQQQPVRAQRRIIRKTCVAAIIILALLWAFGRVLPGSPSVPLSDKPSAATETLVYKSAPTVVLSDKSPASDGCGSRGGPGYRGPDGKCAS